jgi:hypothetical protein
MLVECLSQKICYANIAASVGKPKTATKQQVLRAIPNHKTTSTSKLASHLSVGRATYTAASNK